MSNLRLVDLAIACHRRRLPLLPRVLGRLARLVYSCEVPYTVTLAPDVVFAHRGLGVVLGHDTSVGPRTKILQNVTIGGRSGIRANPRIGADVVIGAGAAVLGDVTVGDGAQIGANAVVLSDVEPGAVVVGVPARRVR